MNFPRGACTQTPLVIEHYNHPNAIEKSCTTLEVLLAPLTRQLSHLPPLDENPK